MITKVDHIGIAVHSIAERSSFYREVLGLEFEGEEVVEEQGVRVAFFRAGETMIELLEPLGEGGPIGKFLEKNGEGVHHVALGCEDIVEGRERIRSAGVRLLSEEPLDGAHGKLISFLHPRDTGRVLLELTQRGEEGEERKGERENLK